ncbi:MAG: hypothetical protein AB7E37_04900 [Candidatus Altimarinota bacterium]
MKTSLKKLVAGASILTLTAMNSVFASSLSLTGTDTSLSLTGATGGTSYSGASVTGSLNLTVTAQVLPTLSLDISAGSLDLGVLDSSIVSTGSLDVKLSTNATDGANVTVSSNTGGLASTQGDLIEYVNTVVAGTQGYNLTVSNNVAYGGAIPSIANATVENLADASILTVDNPTKDAQVTVQANASIDTLTPSGDYSVVHTFTVTGNF